MHYLYKYMTKLTDELMYWNDVQLRCLQLQHSIFLDAYMKGYDIYDKYSGEE
ncbi:MAG: hypothetical protein AAF195_03825 [Pseudomonadota bacterium]